jgi:hypothetical protein
MNKSHYVVEFTTLWISFSLSSSNCLLLEYVSFSASEMGWRFSVILCLSLLAISAGFPLPQVHLPRVPDCEDAQTPLTPAQTLESPAAPQTVDTSEAKGVQDELAPQQGSQVRDQAVILWFLSFWATPIALFIIPAAMAESAKRQY